MPAVVPLWCGTSSEKCLSLWYHFLSKIVTPKNKDTLPLYVGTPKNNDKLTVPLYSTQQNFVCTVCFGWLHQCRKWESAKQSIAQSQRYGYTDSVLTFSKLLEQSDEQSRVVCSNHCLFHLLEKDKSLFHMLLRPLGHSFDLPRYQYNLTRKSFIYRNLYSNKWEPITVCSTCAWGGVHDVYTRRLVTVNYSLYTHFMYLCLNFYVYLYLRSFLDIFTFCASRRRRKMYCGHTRLCVCLCVYPRPYAHTIARTRMSLGGVVADAP